jgi:CspA family cold shock protein
VGTVKWFNTRKGYGFIAQEEGGEVFVHLSGVLDERLRELEVGTPVEFEIEHTARGPQAVDVVPLA